MIMRLLGVFLLVTTGWQSQISASEDPEKYCPCLPPKLCPRIFGLSPVDSKQFGQLPDCTDLTTVRCCGASLTVITEHLGTTKYDEDYLRLGKSPVYIPAKINPIPIPENVMRQMKELSSDDEKQISGPETKNEEPRSPVHEINHSVRNDIEDGGSSQNKSVTIETTLISNDVTTPNPTAVDSTIESLKMMAKNCDGCDQSSVNSSPPPAEYTTEKYISMKNNEMEIVSSHFQSEDNNGKTTDENLPNARTNEQVESSTLITIVGESIDPSSSTVLSDLKLDISVTADSIDIEQKEKNNVNASSNYKSDIVNDTKQTSVYDNNESIAIVNAQPYNIKTMRNLEMPQEVYIILPNEETGRMMSENESNGTDNKYLQMNENKINSSIGQSNEINEVDDEIQNATNRQEVIEKHLDSIVFQSWENETRSVATEKNVSAEELVEDSSKVILETTTETKTKRPKSQQIRHNLYTRKPNSSILLQSRNKINEVTTTTTVSTTTKKDTTVTKKDESVIRREEIERISNLTRDQVASGSEHVPVVVRKLPPPQHKEPSRARAESKVEEDESDMPPARISHFRHPPRVLKPVTKQPPVTKEEGKDEEDIGRVSDDYDYGDVVEEGEETNNDEVVFEGGEGGELVRTPESRSQVSRGRQQLIARSRGGNVFKTPTVEEDKSVDTSEEERMVAMHQFTKIRGQNKFRRPIEGGKQSTGSTLILRDNVPEEHKSLRHDEAVDKRIHTKARVHTSTRTDTVTIPDITTVLPITTSTILPTIFSKTDEEIEAVHKPIHTKARVHTSTRTDTVTIPDITTVLPITTSTILPTIFSKTDEEIEAVHKPIHTKARVRTSTRTDTVTIPDIITVLPITTSTALPIIFSKMDEENSSTSEGALLFQNDDTQDSLLETMEPRKFYSEHMHTQQVKPIELYEGKKLNPVLKNQHQEVYTGRRLVEKKKNFESVTDRNIDTEEKVVVPEVYTGRKLASTTRKPLVVASIQNNSPSLEKVGNLRVTKDKSEDKPSITDEINDKETRQQNSGLQSGIRQRPRKNRLQVTPKTPQPSRNVAGETQTLNEHKEHITAAQSTTESPPEQKSDKASFRGNFLRTRNRVGMIETIIKEKMLMDHAALKSRMLRNAVGSGQAKPMIGTQHGIKDDEVSQLRGGRLSHDNTGRKIVSVEGQQFNDEDLESEGTEQILENRQVPIGFNPPARMERGFVPIVGHEMIMSTSAFTEDGVPVKQLQLPEELEPPQSFNEVQSFQNSLKVVGPLPNGFHHQTLRSTSAFTEDGVPVKQLQLPAELKPPQSFTEGQTLQEEARFDTHPKDPTITKRTLTELVPPVLEAIFFRRSYDDTLVEYNEALMKYNQFINTFLQHQPLNSRTNEKHEDEVKVVDFMHKTR